MIDLRRHLAPISADAWKAIDDEAARVLKLNLAARKLVDFQGPLGWQASAVNVGRVARIAGPMKGVDAVLRKVQPLAELRVSFDLVRSEMDSVDRGAADPELAPVIEAAQAMAHAEDRVVFDGYDAADIRGIKEASPHQHLRIADDYAAYPATVSEALEKLRQAGVDGPYAIALGPRCYAGLMRAMAPGGYPIYEHVRQLLEDRVVWAPAVDGAVVLSTVGGDYELVVGQDVSIGYESHTETHVRLYLVESMTFRVLRPEAAVVLTYTTVERPPAKRNA